jgi:hypothetical protein
MTRVIRRFGLWLGVALLPAAGLGFGPALSGSGWACAATAGGVPHAALVVDTGSGVKSYCVALGASSITGIQLVQKAGQQFGMPYRLGFGGQAVCMLNGVGGPSGDDCLTGQTSYWGYWVCDGSGGWSWSSVGAASTPVHDGDVQGWAWGVGIDGTTHPQPPPTSIDDVCARTPSPSPKPTGAGQGGGGQGNAQLTPSPAAGPSISRVGTPSAAKPSPHHQAASTPAHVGGAKTRSPDGGPTQVLAAGGLPGGGAGGSPVGVLLALGVTLSLGLGGWLRLRTGRSPGVR